jgi:NADH-quinone oxidoreductase subunit L
MGTIISNGLVIGAIYGLVALGITLIYTKSGVLNFANAEAGMFGTFVFYALSVEQDMQYLLAAVVGIAVAAIRLRPARLVPKSRAVEEVGIERVLANKYYVDEAYDAAFVRPTYRVSRGLLWRGVDVGIIDGLAVHGSAYLARFVGWVGSRLQSGQVGTYAWALVIGVLAVLGAFTMR